MSGPWEKYQSEETGPWSKFSEDTPTSELTSPPTKEPDAPEWAGKYPNLYGILGAAKAVLGAGTEMAGMTAGGIVGTALGGPGVGTAAGVAGGYALTKSAQRYAERERLTGTGLAKDTTIGTIFHGAPAAILRGAEKIIAPYAKKFTTMITDKLTQETSAYLKAVEETGYTPTAAEIHGGSSKVMAMAEGLLGYIPGSASLINKARLTNLEKLVQTRNKLIGEGATDDVIEKVGFRVKRDAEEILKNVLGKRASATKDQLDSLTNSLLTDVNAQSSRSVRTNDLANTTKDFFDASGATLKPSEIGKATQDMMAQVKTDRYTVAGNLLKSAKKELGGHELDTPITQDIADNLLKEEMQSSFPNPNILKSLRAYSSKNLPPEIQMIVDKWLENPAMARKNQEAIDALLSEYGGSTKKTWGGLDLDVSKLLENARKANELQGTSFAGSRGSLTREGRVYAQLAGGLKEDMATFAKKANPEAYKSFKEGKDLWRETEELFDRDTLKIMRMAPEDVVKTMSPGEVKNVVRLKEILGEKDFQPFENALIRNIVSFDKDGVINLAKTKVNINKYGETVKNVLSPEKKALLDGFIADANKIEQSYARTKVLSDSLVYDSNGTIKLDATKKKLLTNRESLSQHYTPEDIAKIDDTVAQVQNINLKAVARNKQEAVEFLGSIVGSDNAGVVKAIVKPHNTINIKFMQRILGRERTKEVQEEFLKEYILKINKFGYYSPAKAATTFNQYQSTMKSLMKPDEYHELSNLMELNKRAELLSKMADNPSQTGQTLVGYEIGKKVLNSTSALLLASVGVGYMGFPMAAGGLAAAGAAVATPYALAKIYLSKAGRQWLTLGYTIPAGSQESAKLLMRLSGIAGVDLTQQEGE